MNEATPSDPPTTPDAPPPLELWRSVDWRFLLPDLPLRRVGYTGPVPDDERRVLAELGVEVAGQGELADADVVVARPVDLERCAGLPPGTWVLVRVVDSRPGAAPARAVRGRLAELGLDVVRTWWHAPDRSRCSYIVPVDDDRAVDAMLRRYHGVRLGALKSWVARAANRLGQAERLARDLTVVAHRTLPDRTAGQDGAPLPPDAERGLPGSTSSVQRLLVTPWFEASRHVVCLYVDAGTGVLSGVAKIPRRPQDVAGIRHEGEVLTALAERTRTLTGQAPAVRALVTDGRRPHLLETAVRGTAAGPEAVRAAPERLLESALGFVTALPVTGSTADDAGWFDRLVAGPLQQVADQVGLEELPPLVDRTLDLLAPLRDASLPLVLEHGDLGHPNLVVTADGRLGAVDWERAEVYGLPAHDLVFLLQYVAESLRSTFERPGQLAAFDEAFTGAHGSAGPWLRRYADALAVDEELLPLLVLATFARTSAGLADRVRPVGVPEGPDGRELVRRHLAAAYAPDRDLALWRHAVERFDRLLG